MENTKASSNTFNLQVEKCKIEWKLPKYYQIISILGILLTIYYAKF